MSIGEDLKESFARPSRVFRPSISYKEFQTAIKAVPAPFGSTWEWNTLPDDRLYLFDRVDSEGVCIVYSDGAWEVDSLTTYRFAACGREMTLEDGMRRALKVACALRWQLDE